MFTKIKLRMLFFQKMRKQTNKHIGGWSLRVSATMLLKRLRASSTAAPAIQANRSSRHSRAGPQRGLGAVLRQASSGWRQERCPGRASRSAVDEPGHEPGRASSEGGAHVTSPPRVTDRGDEVRWKGGSERLKSRGEGSEPGHHVR